MFLEPIKYNEKIEKQIANKISDFFYGNLFKGLFDIINTSNRVFNAKTTLLQEAILKGDIYYQDGAFYSKRNKFSLAISKELEQIGAKYSKWRKAYVISELKLNTEVLWAIQTEKARTDATVQALVEFLSVKYTELPKQSDEIFFGELVNKMFLDLQDRLYANAKKHKIEFITPKLDDFQLQEIYKNYVDNLDFWIKSFSEQETIKMRETILQMVLDGKTTQSIADYIQKRYNIVDKHKALFLARNENAIATASYLKAKYQAEGFKYFRWHDSHDERVRTLHRELGAKVKNKYGINGTNIFAFDDPPIIYEQKKDGIVIRQDRGLPGETYNCRCVMSVYVDKELYKRKHDLYLQRQKTMVK